MSTIRVKITMPDGDIWYASAWNPYKNVNRALAYYTQRAAARGVPAKYELATEEEYWAYREKVKKTIRMSQPSQFGDLW